MSDKPSFVTTWIEPESAANTSYQPVYPYNNVTQTKGGHSFEMDDTPTRERVRLSHRSGTFIEMQPNGDEVHKVYGTGYEITVQGKNVEINGACNITINGDSNIHITGNKTEKIDGNYNLQVVGDMIARTAGINGMQLISDNDMTIQSAAGSTGALYVSAGDHMYLASDLVVAGSISADVVSSATRVNAGTGVSAGTLGMYSTGPITSLVQVQAPLGLFGIMEATLMTDTVNSGVYNTHVHIGNLGHPTSQPLTDFFGV